MLPQVKQSGYKRGQQSGDPAYGGGKGDPLQAVDNEHGNNGEGYGESVFTKMIKAGHRTYFIDVKTTRSNDYFLSVTELRKKITQDGSTVNERNKVFVYQEDIDKFTEGLNEVIDYIRSVSHSASDK